MGGGRGEERVEGGDVEVGAGNVLVRGLDDEGQKGNGLLVVGWMD